MTPLRQLCLAFILALTIIAPARAQESTASAPAQTPATTTSAPLLFSSDRLYELDETTQQMTFWTNCDSGSHIQIAPTGIWLGELTRHGIRLCNLQTRQIIDVAAPETPGDIDSVAGPAWSPDGAQVAWAVAYKTGAHQLYTYDLGTAKARILVDKLPPPSAFATRLIWGKSGILVAIDNLDDDARIAPLYAPDGTLLQPNLASDEPYISYFWVTDQTGKEYLGRYSYYNRGTLLDTQTGTVYNAEEIDLYSLLAPEGLSLTMNLDSGAAVINLPDGRTQDIADLSTRLIDFNPELNFDPTYVAISPDGKAVGFFSPDPIIWRDGKVTQVTKSIPRWDETVILWGPMGYRVKGKVYIG